MKKIFLLLAFSLLAFSATAQKYTEDDIKQFYRTIQGDYTAQLNDSTSVALHLTPIWEREGDPFHWLYLEAVSKESKKVIAQNILEVVPVSDIIFRVYVYQINSPETFVGKWGNRNFFDGFNSKILKGKKKFSFMKTKDFEYQTEWSGRKSLKCFPSGDRVHFKFVQEDERLYVKRVPRQSSRIFGITFFKAPTD